MKHKIYSWCILLLSISQYLCNSEYGVKDCRCVPQNSSCWPSVQEWNDLNQTVNGHLIVPILPIHSCLDTDSNVEPSKFCKEELEQMGNDPYYLQTLSGGTESTGQANAWKAMPSNYAIEAADENDIIAGVQFSVKHNLRLVVKGTGHDYYGRSNYKDSLLIWTHRMRDIRFHDNFIPSGGEDEEKWSNGIPAVTMEAGLTWMDVYTAATQDRNVWVEGGACTSVGVVGWYIGGGFGPQSKKFGTGAANLLEAKVITSNGDVVIANEYQNPDLFYALRGGGHGFGIVVSLTSRTHSLPKFHGSTTGFVKGRDKTATINFLAVFLEFFENDLSNNWGEHISFSGLQINVLFISVDVSLEESRLAWKPIVDWLEMRQDEYVFEINHEVYPFKLHYNINFQNYFGDITPSELDPREPDRTFFWNGSAGEISAYWMSYYSRWLTNSEFMDRKYEGAKKIVDLVTQFDGDVTIFFSKGQYGASDWAVKELELLPIHPSLINSFALLVAAQWIHSYSPLVPYDAQNNTSNINEFVERCGTSDMNECWIIDNNRHAFEKFREQTPDAGAYFNEADYFEPKFHEAFWGQENYETLTFIKEKWDPHDLFYCHNCVGSEKFEEGGMCRK